MSGLFAMVNILADTSGPGTLGLKGHDPSFAVVSGKKVVIKSFEATNRNE